MDGKGSVIAVYGAEVENGVERSGQGAANLFRCDNERVRRKSVKAENYRDLAADDPAESAVAGECQLRCR